MPADFFKLSGVVATEIKNFDWGKTSLGTFDNWPEELKLYLNLIFNSAVPMQILWGPDYIHFYNEHYLQVLKSTGKSSLIGLSIKEAFPEVWMDIHLLLNSCMAGKAVFEKDFPFTFHNGDEQIKTYFDFSYNPIICKDNSVGGIFVTVSETTKSVLASREINELNERFALAISAADLGYFEYDIPEKKIFLSARTREIFSLPISEDITPEQILNIVNADDVNTIKNIFRELLTSNNNRLNHTFKIKRNNSFAFIRVYALRVTEDDVIKKFSGTLQDITEEEVAKEVLLQNEKKFHEMANSLEEKVFSTSPNRDPIFISDKWKEFFGSQNPRETFFKNLHPDDRQKYEEAWAQSMAHSQPFEIILRLMDHSGQYRWQRGYTKPIFGQDGNVEKWIGTYSDIHEKKLNEEFLELQSQILNSMDECVCVWQEKGEIIYTNSAFNSTFGFKAEELRGKNINLLNNGLNPLKEIEESIDQKGFWKGRLINKTKKGTEFISRAHIGSFYRNGNKLMYSVQQSITEELLRNLELSRFKYMVDNFTDPVVLIKQDGSFAYINNIALQQWEYSAKAVSSITIFDLFPGYNKSKFDKAFKAAQKSHIAHFELNIVTNKGNSFPVELSLRGLVLDNIQYLFAVIRDISERKLAEFRLALSYKQFREMAETMPQLVYTTDANGKLTYFNKAVIDFTGASAHELRDNGLFKFVYSEDWKLCKKSWNESLATGKPFYSEARLKFNNGEYKWMLNKASCIKNQNNEVVTWVGTLTDIHDSKIKSEQLEESVEMSIAELIKVNAKLTQSNSELEQFAYVASHDLQEPLRKIKTFTSMLSETAGNLTDTEKVYLDKIISSSNRMSSLIKDVLDFAKLSKGDVEFLDVDLNLVLENVKQDLELQIQNKDVNIVSANLPILKAIPIQMNQLLFNLISNSIKFGKAGEKVTVDISVRNLNKDEILKLPVMSNNRFFEITIKDNGIGFEQTYSDKIFNIFQRLNTRSFAGTGIGLALCRRIVIYHGGYIYAKSEPQNGAEFHVILPYRQKSR